MMDVLLVLLALTNLALLGSSRLGACINTVALQGVLLALLSLFAPTGECSLRLVVLSIGMLVLKAFVCPWLLRRALRGARVSREIEPFIGYTASLMIGLLALGLSFWLSERFPRLRPDLSPLVLPVALATVFSGLFLIVSRRKALTQALGYLVMENGIFAIGVALSQELSFLVELGVLLDVFFAVFVMGITLFHIQREFDHIDADRLSSLKDWSGRFPKMAFDSETKILREGHE